MRYFFYLTLLLIFGVQLSTKAQKPQTILGIAKEVKSADYYQEQARLWKKEIEKDRSNAWAWHQHFKAQRAYLQKSQSSVWVNNKPAIFKQLSPILEEAKRYIGQSFDYHFLLGVNSLGEASIGHFKKAYSIDPERTETYGWLFTYYVPLFNEKKLEEFAKKMLEHNIYSNANYKWNYNTLQTIQKDGVFISIGDMDGLPKWVLQYGHSIRKDVLVINKWFLANEKEYRQLVFQKIQIKEPQKTIKDFETPLQYADYLCIWILKHSKRPTYMPCGTNVSFFKEHGIEDKMYLVGTAFLYSDKKFDNLDTLRVNFEKKYDLEYLFHNFQTHTEDHMVKSTLNLTYLPGLTKLRKYYQFKNDREQLKYYNKLIDTILEGSGKKERLLRWFNLKIQDLIQKTR